MEDKFTTALQRISVLFSGQFRAKAVLIALSIMMGFTTILLFSKSAVAQSDVSKAIVLKCSDAVATLVCNYDTSPSSGNICGNHTLFINPKNQGNKLVPVPNTHDRGSIPVSLSCAKSSRGPQYIVVDYLAGPKDCNKCHVTEIFDSSGARLTVTKSAVKIYVEYAIQESNSVGLGGN